MDNDFSEYDILNEIRELLGEDEFLGDSQGWAKRREMLKQIMGNTERGKARYQEFLEEMKRIQATHQERLKQSQEKWQEILDLIDEIRNAIREDEGE